MRIIRDDITSCMRLLQLSDSALPIGAFSFSSALETAVGESVVTDAVSLSDYVHSIVTQSAYTDGVAAVHAFRSAATGDYDSVVNIDRRILAFRLNDEGRVMLCRMGRKLAELGTKLISDETLTRWTNDIRGGVAPGTHPVAIALMCNAVGLHESEMFCSHIYGVASMVLNAALRCLKVSHYDTQQILYDIAESVGELYDNVSRSGLNDMNSFCPQIDILSSMHEVGGSRMFMS